jgi:hypothetical protein
VFLVGAATGGVLFGWLGDRIGRVRAMSLSVITYAVFTGLCGLAAAPWQIAILRFIAALGMGGEWSLGVALVMEVWPNRSRGLMAGLIGAAANVGSATGVDRAERPMFPVDPKAEQIDPSTERIVLIINQPYANHNGGQLLFGRHAPLIVDLGCGNGRFLLASALARPECDHIGIDILPMVLRYATRRGNQRGLSNLRFAAKHSARSSGCSGRSSAVTPHPDLRPSLFSGSPVYSPGETMTYTASISREERCFPSWQTLCQAEGAALPDRVHLTQRAVDPRLAGIHRRSDGRAMTARIAQYFSTFSCVVPLVRIGA